MRPGRERLRQDLVARCHQGLDVPGFFGRAQQVLGRFVSFDGCCWLTFDPATVLPTGHIPYRSIPPEQVPRAVENEYAEEDVNKFAVLARDARHVGVLSQATGGRRDRSIRYQVVLVPNGFENELRVAFVQDGSCWAGWRCTAAQAGPTSPQRRRPPPPRPVACSPRGCGGPS
jgi:hypothetical protein